MWSRAAAAIVGNGVFIACGQRERQETQIQDLQGFLGYAGVLDAPGLPPILAFCPAPLSNTMKLRPLPVLLLAIALASPLVITAQQPAFRSAIDVVSMNVTVTDSTEQVHHGPRREGLRDLRRRRQAGSDALQPQQSAGRALPAHRHQLEHGRPHGNRPGRCRSASSASSARPTSAKSSGSTAGPKCCRSSRAAPQSSSRRFARPSPAARRR